MRESATQRKDLPPTSASPGAASSPSWGEPQLGQPPRLVVCSQRPHRSKRRNLAFAWSRVFSRDIGTPDSVPVAAQFSAIRVARGPREVRWEMAAAALSVQGRARARSRAKSQRFCLRHLRASAESALTLPRPDSEARDRTATDGDHETPPFQWTQPNPHIPHPCPRYLWLQGMRND